MAANKGAQLNKRKNGTVHAARALGAFIPFTKNINADTNATIFKKKKDC